MVRDRTAASTGWSVGRVAQVLCFGGALVAWNIAALLAAGETAAQAARAVTLEEALDLASQHSPVLRASRQELHSAEAQQEIAKSAYLPKLDAIEAWTNTNNPAQAFAIQLNQGRFTQAGFDINTLNRPGSIENYRSALNLVQPIYNGGREQLGVKIAELGQEASAEGYEHAKQRVFFGVTRGYYDLALAKAVRKVATDAVQIAEANARQIAARYKSGATVKSDLLQADVRLAGLREESIRAEQMLHITAVALQHAIGLNEAVDTADSLSQGTVADQRLEALIARALESRPDYRMMAAELRKAQMATKLSKSSYLPNLNLQGSFENNGTFPLGPNGQSNYGAFGMFSVNLFNGLSDAAHVRKARAQEEKAREQLEAKRREIEVEVVEAYYGVAAAKERIAVSESAVAQAEENLRIIGNRYQSGIAPVLDLLTAELVLNQAKQNRLRSFYDLKVGQARLALVSGEGRS
ncbi:MAG TPA: TolC family protein [Nitrospiraceae bacterium]|nr:TolC family protein [Nitrospiraceae bacterium]